MQSALERPDDPWVSVDWNKVDEMFSVSEKSLSALALAAGHDPARFFRGRDFSGLDLRGIDVRGVDLSDADLTGTKIGEAKIDRTTILKGARIDDEDRALLAQLRSRKTIVRQSPRKRAPFGDLSLDLKGMSLDDLWSMHEQITGVLSTRIISEKRELEERLANLNMQVDKDKPRSRRKYPSVLPKYQNPSTKQTWSGRGKPPKWLVSAVQGGRNINDYLQISTDNVSPSKSGKKKN